MPIVFISPDPLKAVGLENLLADYHVICSFKTVIVDYLRSKNVNVFCLEEEKKQDFNMEDEEDLRNTGKLMEETLVLEYLINLKQKYGKDLKILTFKSTSKIANIAKKLQIDLLVPDFKIARDLEDKVTFYKIFENVEGVNLLPHKVGILKDFDYEDLKKYLGEKFVIQLRRGFAGSSTNFIENKEEFDTLKMQFGEHEVKITKFIEGLTLTTNGCISDAKVIIEKPFLQITGIEELNKFKGGTCGISFDAVKNLDFELIDDLIRQGERIGETIAQEGFKGIFGLDFALNLENKKIYIIECNARMPISVPHFSKRQEALNLKPIILEHVEAWGQIPLAPFIKGGRLKSPLDKGDLGDYAFLKGASIILRNTSDKNLKIKKSLSLKWHIFDVKKNIISETEFAFGFDPPLPQSSEEGTIYFLPVSMPEGFETHTNMAFCDLYFLMDVLDEKFELKKEIMNLVKILKKQLLT